VIVEAIATGSLVRHRRSGDLGVVVAQARMNVNMVVVRWLTGRRRAGTDMAWLADFFDGQDVDLAHIEKVENK